MKSLMKVWVGEGDRRRASAGGRLHLRDGGRPSREALSQLKTLSLSGLSRRWQFVCVLFLRFSFPVTVAILAQGT